MMKPAQRSAMWPPSTTQSATDDAPYRGIQIPLRFWKVVAFVQDGALAATGYILDQTPLVSDLDAVLAEAAAAGEVPPLGAFRTFQVPIADIAALTRLAMPELVAADRMPTTVAAAGWRQVEALDEILL